VPSHPRPRTVYGQITLCVLLLTGNGCATSSWSVYPADEPAREASEVPERFLVGTIQAGGELSDPRPGEGCRNPMVDPRDGTRLRLVQSQSAGGGSIGDYEVPEGRYGIRPGELLRMNCGTGRVIGIIPMRG
jgi:hypothetical protein